MPISLGLLVLSQAFLQGSSECRINAEGVSRGCSQVPNVLKPASCWLSGLPRDLEPPESAPYAGAPQSRLERLDTSSPLTCTNTLCIWLSIRWHRYIVRYSNWPKWPGAGADTLPMVVPPVGTVSTLDTAHVSVIDVANAPVSDSKVAGGNGPRSKFPAGGPLRTREGVTLDGN